MMIQRNIGTGNAWSWTWVGKHANPTQVCLKS